MKRLMMIAGIRAVLSRMFNLDSTAQVHPLAELARIQHWTDDELRLMLQICRIWLDLEQLRAARARCK